MSELMQLGALVERVDERNAESESVELLGLSIEKVFIKSVANTIGTDLSKYKVIRENEFAVSLMQVSRDEKIPVACLKGYAKAIMSPAYSIFKIKDERVVLADYLAMWFKRSEFDRKAAYIAVGGVRGSMPWEEFARIRVRVPSLEEQKRIVNQYRIIEDRIELKRRINDNLLKSATALYRKWFVELAPFGGAAPDTWSHGTVADIADLHDSQRKPLSGIERADMERLYPYYGAVSVVDYVDDFLFDGEYILLSEDGIYVVDDDGHPLLQHVTGRFWVNNHAHIMKGKNGFSEDSLFLFLSDMNMAPIVTGAAQPKINQANLRNFPVMIPDLSTMKEFNQLIAPMFDHRLNNKDEIMRLESVRGLLLSKLAS